MPSRSFHTTKPICSPKSSAAWGAASNAWSIRWRALRSKKRLNPNRHRDAGRLAGAADVKKREKGAPDIATRNRYKKDNPRVSKAKPVEDTKEAPLEVYGSIKQVFPSTTFSVELDNGHVILAHIAGRLRRHHIKILPGDRVDVELSPYDLTKGRIVYRYRAGEARRT
jgi:translation initiation factor IF-1